MKQVKKSCNPMPLFVGLVAVLLVLATNVNTSQAQSDFSINVSSRVISNVELITLQPITPSDADAIDNIITIDPTNSANAGKMMAIGTPNSEVQITYIRQLVMSNSQTGNTITFNYSVAGNSLDDQTSAELLNRDNKGLQFNSEGRFYFWIGGHVDITTADPGNYVGEFTLDIEYL
jgi:hypothetical protein